MSILGNSLSRRSLDKTENISHRRQCREFRHMRFIYIDNTDIQDGGAGMEVFARRMQHHVTWPTSVCRRHLRTVAARLTVQSPGHSKCPGTRTSTGQRSFAAYGPGPGTDYQRQLWVSCTIVQSCCDCTASSASTTNVQTRLDSTRLDALPAKKIYGQVLKLELPNVQCTC